MRDFAGLTELRFDDDCDPPNAWWNASIPNQATAAFHFGRLLNQLNYTLPFEIFFVSKDNKQLVREVAARLRSLFHRLSSSPAGLEDRFAKQLDNFYALANCEAIAEEARACFSQSEDGEEAHERTRRREQLIESLVCPLIQELREAVLKTLSGDERNAMQLGEVLDQGIRPRNPHTFFEADWVIQGRGYKLDIPNALSTPPIENPVDLPIEVLRPKSDSAWLEVLKRILEHDGIPAAEIFSPSPGTQHTSLESDGGILHLVQQIDFRIRRYLERSDPNGSIELPIMDAAASNLQYKNIVYNRLPTGTCEAVEALINAQGQPTALSKLIGKPSRWHAKLRQAAPPLAAIIERAPGNKGYRITIFD